MKRISILGFAVLSALAAGPASADCASECAYAYGGYGSYNFTTCYNLQCKNKVAFGAIAYGARSLAYGYGFEKSSKADADETAMVNCRANGNDCKIVVDFSNSCAAVAAVEEKGRFATGVGPSRAAAQTNALAACKSQVGGQCEIETWTCSMP